ncbi:hypothetical protein Patl1_30160 [Pistacia atlantica]|uniref:Uncharacterized protein n=1 Tax=Pistacia atlantica TaxID=434234 RepID=A0ACC1ACC8_9ROSI|nr:hypothetical protein Patl1_30160 [Pistacia atlantica]
MRNLSVFSFSLLMLLHFGEANNQADNLYSLIKSKRSLNNHGALPGQPDGVDFDQYGGYVTVDPQAGRALFYYFVESPQNFSTNPFVLWLNGGPGCSSFGYGAMRELGPFRVNTDVANVIFLESPAGVGFSYSNTSSDYGRTGDKSTANDAYTFLVNWLERFPQYKNRDFYIAGESYAGHCVPQLAYTILLNNENSNQTIIKLKGIAIGNAWIDDAANTKGLFDFLWTHALNSDEANKGFHMYCDFENDTSSSQCDTLIDKALFEMGNIDFYHIYAPICIKPALQKWFHWFGSPTTILPIIKDLMESGTRVWIYSGDVDGRVPITLSRYSINTLNLPIQTVWHPWYINDEVGGYVVEYEGVTPATVRGAGHLAPSYQPERALLMISSFLQGILPPSSP